MSYDPVNAVSAPEVDGFQGGVYYADNVTKEFVGYGDGSSCANQNPVGCYIRTVNGPGCYISCGGPERFDNLTAKYLLNHPQLTWVPTNTTAMRTLPNVLQISGNGWIFFFGRILYQGYYQVGKLHAGPGTFTLYIQEPSGATSYSTEFEVLTCAPVTTTTSTTTVPTTTLTTGTTISTTTTIPTTSTTITSTTLAPCGSF